MIECPSCLDSETHIEMDKSTDNGYSRECPVCGYRE